MENEPRAEASSPPNTQAMTDRNCLNTQEREEYFEERRRLRDRRLTARIAQHGVTLAISNKNRDAERKRTREKDAEVMRAEGGGGGVGRKNPKSDELVVESSPVQGEGAAAGTGAEATQIPKPTQTAEAKEVAAWRRLNSQPTQMRQLILQVKRDLEGGGAVEWKECQATGR